MSALDAIKQNLGVATQPSLVKDAQSKGTTQPVIEPKTPTSAVDAIRSSLASNPPVATPVTPKTEDKKGLYDKYAEGVRKGIVSFDAGFVSSVGQLLRSFQWASDRVVGGLTGQRIDTEKSFAISAQDKTKEWADILKKSEGITPENQSFVNKVFEGAGTSATYFIPAIGVTKGVSVLAKVSPSIAMLFGSSASASLESMAEAGQVYDEVKKKEGVDKATVASTKTFWANAILLTVTERLGVFNPNVKGLLKKALLSAPTEAFQESVQQIIQNTETGRPTWEGVLESGAIGGIIGSVMGGTVDAITGENNATPVQINDAEVNSQVNVEGEKKSAYEALKQNLKPAIEIQKGIEESQTTPLSPTESPTSKTPENGGQGGIPVGEGSGAKTELPKADVKIPSYAQAEKLITKEGGYANASSLPATNRADAVQLADSLSLNPKFLYTQATKQGVKLRDFLLRVDAETDTAKRVAIGEELMSTLSQKPAKVETNPVVENVKEIVQQNSPAFISSKIDDKGFYTEARYKDSAYAKMFEATKDIPDTRIKKGDKVAIIKKGNIYEAVLSEARKLDETGISSSRESNINPEDFVFAQKKQNKDTKKTSTETQPKSGSKGASVGKFKNTYNLNDPTDIAILERTFNEETVKNFKKGIFEYGRYKTKAEIEKLIGVNIVSEKFEAPKLKLKEYKGGLTFYHGTSPKNIETIQKEGFKKGSELPEDAFRSGGYGRIQDSISLSSDPMKASIFTGSKAEGGMIEVKVSPDAKIVSVDNIEDATDLDEYKDQLKGVDAVWIGGGEKELVVLNSKILTISRTTTFNVRTAKEDLASFIQPTSGSKGASVGRYRDGTELEAPAPDSLKPIAFPELLDLAKELTGNIPFLKKYQKSNGMFYGKEGGQIGLNPTLFEKGNERQLSATFAHEIGHLVDYLPDETLSRGNLMARLNTLKNFNKDFFAPAGASRSNPELKTQMWELSKYWRPIDEATATASFLKYRKSSEEIYADFISALFNEPRTVSQIAPTAYNVFFQQLDAKPEVKQAYFELQDLLRNGDLVAKRRSATQSMFKLTEQESKERQIQNEIDEKNKEKSIWYRFKTQAVDITESVREKVKQAEAEGKTINPDDNPTYYLEERNYLGGKIKAEVDEKFNTIYQELQKENLSWEDLGELMFYERILKGDRQEIANPLGYQPDFVKELYDVYEDVGSVKPDQEAHKKGTSDMKSTLGEAKFQKLQKLAEEYRSNLKSFFEEGRAEGLYNEELAKMFEENAYYVPFKGAKYSGVTKTTFGVKQQKGTLGNIENPANTGIEKAVSIIRAIERNKVTRKTMEFMQENFTGEVQEAKTDKNGYPIDPKEKDLGLVTYMKDGKVKGFYVDKYIADAIQKNTVADQNLLVSSLRFWNSKLFRPLFITFNLGFQSFNAIRDFKRFWKNVPDMTVLKAIGLYSKSLRASKIRAFGLPINPTKADIEAYNLINNLEKSQVLSITYNDVIKGEAIEDAQIDRILREVGVRETEQTKLGELGAKIGVDKNTPIIKQAIQIMDFIEKTGNLVESIPKIAGVYALEGKMQPREMRSFVRKYVGSPDFMAGGKFKPYMNEIFLFSNAIFQGVRSDFEIATQPKTRGAFWLKTAQAELVPKLLMLMATAGLFGEALKEMFAKIGDYDKTNYTVIPMGIDENGKTVYFRIPSDETGRLIGGLFWKLARTVQDPSKLADADTYGDLLAYAGGQVPSLTPVATSAFNIREFLAGNNPYDFFRGQPVLTTEQMQAGGMEKLKPFLSYMFQQLGGGVFAKLYTNETVPKNPTLSEKIVSLPVVSNIAGRFIKSSDYGETERIREVTGEVRSEKAKENIANRATVYKYVEKAQNKPYGEVRAIKQEMVKEVYNGLPQTPEDRLQARNLEKRFDTLLLRGKSDAKVDALITAPSNEEKVALLVEYSLTMKPSEFAELKQFIIKNRVVSSDVFQKFNRVDK